MDIPTIIEVAIGLAVVYYIAGLIVSFFAAQISTAFEMKGRDLYKTLKNAFGDQFNEVLNNDLIQKLAPLKQSPTTRIVQWVKRKYKNEVNSYIEKIPISTLAITILDQFNAKEHAATAIGSLIAPGVDQLKKYAQDLDANIHTMQQDALKNIEGWVDGLISSASELYKRNIRVWVILIALAVTVGLNIDTLAIGKFFYEEPTARELAIKEMDAILATAQTNPDGTLIVPESYQTEANKLTALTIPMWWPLEPLGDKQTPTNFWTLKVLGWLISSAAVAQGSSFWYDALKKLKGVHTKVVKSTGEESAS